MAHPRKRGGKEDKGGGGARNKWRKRCVLHLWLAVRTLTRTVLVPPAPTPTPLFPFTLGRDAWCPRLQPKYEVPNGRVGDLPLFLVRCVLCTAPLAPRTPLFSHVLRTTGASRRGRPSCLALSSVQRGMGGGRRKLPQACPASGAAPNPWAGNSAPKQRTLSSSSSFASSSLLPTHTFHPSHTVSPTHPSHQESAC